MQNSAKPARGAPAFRTIASRIEARILAGEMTVGDVLPSETALATQLGFNRSTIREAIRLLEQNGLVGRRGSGKKLFVTAPQQRDVSQRLRATMILNEVTFHELWEVMAAIEPLAAEAAARKAADTTLARLADNLARTEAELKRGSDVVALDIEFHDLVAEAAGNRALRLGREAIGQLFYPAFLQVMNRLNAGERLLLAHRRIYDAIRRRNEREARDWMDRHIADFKRGCELADLDFDGPIGAKLARHADGAQRLRQ